MAPPHDPNKPGRGYVTNPRVTDHQALPALPEGYTWPEQIKKYCPSDYDSAIRELSDELVADLQPPTGNEAQFFRTGVSRDHKKIARSFDGGGQNNKNNFNRLSGVFCHRGFYDQYAKEPENSVAAIDKGLHHNLMLHELDVRLHTNRDKTKSVRGAFLHHDGTGKRTGTGPDRWSQNDGRHAIGTPIVVRGIDLDKEDYASTCQETLYTVEGLGDLLKKYDRFNRMRQGYVQRPQRAPTFQFDLRDGEAGGKIFATMLAWFRYQSFTGLGVILKGYNTDVTSGSDLKNQVEAIPSDRGGQLLESQDLPDVITALASRKKNPLMASGSSDAKIRVWQADTGVLIQELEGHKQAVTSVSFSEDWQVLASGSQDNTVQLWNPDTGDHLATCQGHTGPVTCVTFIPNYPLVVSGSADATIRVWSETGDEVNGVTCAGGAITCIAPPSSDGVKVAAASSNGTIMICDFNSRNPLEFQRTLEKRKYGTVTALATSFYSLITGSDNGRIYIWKPDLKELVATLEGHSGRITSLDIHDWQLASASNDSTCKLWNLVNFFPWRKFATDNSAQPVFAPISANQGNLFPSRPYVTLTGHTGPINAVAFAPAHQSTPVVTGGLDKTMRVWSHSHVFNPLEDRDKFRSLIRIVMVFFSHPIRDLALRKKNLSMENTDAKLRYKVLDYHHLAFSAWEHITSFLDTEVATYGQWVFEIVHSGLGLGYRIDTDTAVSIEDGSVISDPDMLVDCRLDRAMIEVNLALMRSRPQMIFSSCTRLSDVYTSNYEYSAATETGHLKRKPNTQDHAGIQGRLRKIHGGLYPQSDMVVADDPYSEIAARTWIDEEGKMDRSQLLHMTYEQWLKTGPKGVEEAINRINGQLSLNNARFLPNTVKENPIQHQWPSPAVPGPSHIPTSEYRSDEPPYEQTSVLSATTAENYQENRKSSRWKGFKSKFGRG